jgi:hypothetical protein
MFRCSSAQAIDGAGRAHRPIAGQARTVPPLDPRNSAHTSRSPASHNVAATPSFSTKSRLATSPTSLVCAPRTMLSLKHRIPSSFLSAQSYENKRVNQEVVVRNEPETNSPPRPPQTIHPKALSLDSSPNPTPCAFVSPAPCFRSFLPAQPDLPHLNLTRSIYILIGSQV